MPQYLLAVHHRGPYPTLDSDEGQRMLAATGAFTDRLHEAGQWVFVGGLRPVETATVVDGTTREVVVTDGVYSESKEHLAGFWIVDVADHDEALALAAEATTACHDPVVVRPSHQV